MSKISLIITYFNEQNNLETIFNKILKQTLLPDEVLFVNSNSNDESHKIVDNLIKNYSGEIIFKNILFNTSYTSDSANLGIYLSKNSIIAFMDCGLDFPDYWLEKQYGIMHKNNVDVVFGKVELRGNNFFDVSSVSQTYGFLKKNDCVPGALVKKSVFNKIGYFIAKRAFYDVLWRRKVIKSNIPYLSSKSFCIKYKGINYAKNFISALKKNIEYTNDLYEIKTYKSQYIYIYIPIILVILFFLDIKFLYYFTIFYTITRLVIPFIKSNKIKEIPNKILFLISLPFSGLAIDIGKLIGNYIGFFKHFHKKGYIYIFFVSLIILLNTPFFWFLGDKLVIRDKPLHSDAIVVFSGNGEAGYINPSYQKRAIDAVNYFNEGYAKKIILSSGKKQVLSEVNLLKILILSNGVPEKAIKIFDVYPKNTSDNVKLVNNHLKLIDAKQIIFITSPYHSKRAKLIWKKNNPLLNVLSVQVIDTPSQIPVWRLSFNEIRVICYEYLSILYNKFKGNL